jgi:hypothetical protein
MATRVAERKIVEREGARVGGTLTHVVSFVSKWYQYVFLLVGSTT